MAASVLFACGLNEKVLPSYVHISEESSVDGSFLISSILGQRLRISNAGTLLICLQHNYHHYFNAGMRLGYNSNIFLGKTLNVIDPLTDIAFDSITSKWLTDSEKITQHLLESIQEHVITNFPSRINNVILIDNLSILLNLGASNEDIIQLCYNLSDLAKKHENLTVVTKMSNCDIYALANNNISKLGDLCIRITKMKSGIFHEVDGKLLIERDATALAAVKTNQDEEENNFTKTKSCKEILFKINDRNIKIFNPGEIGIKV